MNINELTLGELASIEMWSGQPLSHLGDEDKPQMRLTGALVTVLKRRNGEPQFEFKAAMNMNQTELSEFLESVGFNADEDEEGKAEEN